MPIKSTSDFLLRFITLQPQSQTDQHRIRICYSMVTPTLKLNAILEQTATIFNIYVAYHDWFRL